MNVRPRGQGTTALVSPRGAVAGRRASVARLGIGLGLVVGMAACASAPPAIEPLASPSATSIVAVHPPTVTQDIPTSEPAVTGTAVQVGPTASAPCPIRESGGLITELQRIGAEMPGLDTEGMRVPTVEQMLAWSAVVEAARRDDLATACQLMDESQFPYQVVEFTDLPSESRRVILLREDLPIRAGWGTVVLRPDATQETPPVTVQVQLDPAILVVLVEHCTGSAERLPIVGPPVVLPVRVRETRCLLEFDAWTACP